MRKRIQEMMSGMFGPSRNDQYAAMLKGVSTIALECAAHFRATDAQDVAGVIAFEHQADKLVGEIHELLDNSFIMRFDIPDAMRLADDLDDTIDGMRKVVLHVDAYRSVLGPMRPEARELMELGGEMLVHIDKLISMLAEPKLSLARVRAVADTVDAMEAKADKIVAARERELVVEFSAENKPTLGFIAWHQLFHMLERLTDDANHCARQVLSLARKEA